MQISKEQTLDQTNHTTRFLDDICQSLSATQCRASEDDASRIASLLGSSQPREGLSRALSRRSSSFSLFCSLERRSLLWEGQIELAWAANLETSSALA